MARGGLRPEQPAQGAVDQRLARKQAAGAQTTMKQQQLQWLTKLLASMPAGWRLRLADALTWLLLRLPNRRQRRARENIRRCLQPPPEAAAALLRAHLQHRADSLLELGITWHWSLPRLLALITEVHGWEHLQQAASAGHGVIVAVPHFGNWELASLYLGQQLAPTGLLYKPPGNAALEAWLSSYRGRAGTQVLPANRRGIAGFIRLLQRRGYGGILPDQTPPPRAGRLAPLFGQPANTMTLLVRLQQKTAAQVVFAGCRRLPDRRHFALHVLPAPPALYASDQLQALTAMNQGIEAIAKLAPAQYQWSYHRYRQLLSEPSD